MDLSKPNYLCLPGRMGVLCGACAENLSSVFGSQDCKMCSNYWLFTIPLFALVGLLIVVVLFLSNFTVTQGYLMSIVFYTNLVGINFDIFFNLERQTYAWLWTSWLNLELGFPLCFYDGMTQIGKSSLQCIFPVYLLLIAIGIIVLSRRSRFVAKLTFSRGIQVLATIVYLSFNKMLRYFIDITVIATLTEKNGVTRVWWLNGNIEYFTSLHAVIVILPAAVTFVFIATYSLMVIFIRPIEQLTSKLKPFLDAHGGPFKDKFRFWFGLRLVVLTVMCLVYVSLGADDPNSAVSVQQTILALLMILQAYFRPFRDNLINTLDLLLMMNLYLAFLAVENSTQDRQFTFIVTLVGWGFILSILYILYHVYNFPKVHAKIHPKVQMLKQLRWSAISSICRRKWGRGKRVGPGSAEGSSRIGISGTTSTIVSLRTAEDVDATTRPRSAHFSQLREPSIEDETAF